MRDKIIDAIADIEKEHGVEVLLAVETGSRAWGFPSPDSDYDVRLLYKHDLDWYLTLRSKKDNIEKMVEEYDFDITGWDIKKALELLKKSNGALLERVQSPIIYKVDKQFLEKMQKISQDFYSPIASCYHYSNLCKNAFELIEGKTEVNLKKLFYALRAATACKWIFEKSTNPPIVFSEMYLSLDLPTKLVARIDALILQKATLSEGHIHTEEPLINGFIREQLNRVATEANSLSSKKGDLIELDTFFQSIVK